MEWVVLLHVVAAFLFVGGLIGRNLTLMMARTSQDIRMVAQFLALAGRFESWLVIPGSFAVLLLGLLAAFSEHLSFVAEGNRWLLVSLLIFVATDDPGADRVPATREAVRGRDGRRDRAR